MHLNEVFQIKLQLWIHPKINERVPYKNRAGAVYFTNVAYVPNINQATQTTILENYINYRKINLVYLGRLQLLLLM